jgi:hypothetical protein
MTDLDEQAIDKAARSIVRDWDRLSETERAEWRLEIKAGVAAYLAARGPKDADAVTRVKAILDYDSEPHARDYVETIVAAARGPKEIESVERERDRAVRQARKALDALEQEGFIQAIWDRGLEQVRQRRSRERREAADL